MSFIRKFAPAGILAVAVLAAAPLVTLAQQEHEPADGPHGARMHEYLEQRMERHLDRLAARLEIRASQQEAWKGFAGAVRGMVPAAPPEAAKDKDLDAAARARRAADRAAERAKHLAQLADATARLEQVLDPPQKEVLNEVAKEFGHSMHGFGHEAFFHGMHDDHCDGAMHDGPMHEEHGMMHHGDGMHDN
jgi:hypothetical protein